MVRGWHVPAFGGSTLVDGGVAGTAVPSLELERGVDLGTEDPGDLDVEVEVPVCSEVVVPVLSPDPG